jgi:hypothetical protein
MRDLHAQIRREVARKDMADHIKLGPGGIREIEFMAQVFQLIRGGRDPALQIRPTLKVLPLLVARRLLPARQRARTVRRLRLPAPPRTPPAIRQRRADAHAADARRGAAADRPFDGLCRLASLLACSTRIASASRGISSRSSPTRKKGRTRWPASGSSRSTATMRWNGRRAGFPPAKGDARTPAELPPERQVPAVAGANPRAPRRPRPAPDRSRGRDDRRRTRPGSAASISSKRSAGAAPISRCCSSIRRRSASCRRDHRQLGGRPTT